MKFNFPKRHRKKNGVNEDTRVTRVIIMAERPETPPDSSPSITRPANKIAKNVQPPSPTCVKDQVQFDARIGGGEEKETDSIAAWNVSYNGVACNHALGDNCTSDSKDFEAAKRWEELRQMIHTKMEDVQGNVFGDFGEFAMSAVEKNRNEMDKLVGNLDKDSSLVGPMNWLWDKEKADYEFYDSPMVTCGDVNACLEASENTYGEPVPSA